MLQDAEEDSAMGIAAVPPTFETYLEHMKPYAERIVSGQVRSHPYMERDDLLQEAFEELWLIWRKFSQSLDFTHICKIGSIHMKNRVLTNYQHSISRKEGTAHFLYLDADVRAPGSTKFHDITRLLEETPESGLLLRDTLERWPGLTPQDRNVLHELLLPSPRTLENICLVRQESKSRRTFVSMRNDAIGRTLGVTSAAVGKSWKRLQEVADQVVNGGSPEQRYTGNRGSTQSDDRGEQNMVGGSGSSLVVDPSEIPGTEEAGTTLKPPKAQAVPKAPAQAKAAPKTKPAAAKAPAAPAPAAPKPVAAQKPATPAPLKGLGALAVNTKVVFVETSGGAKRGTVGVIAKAVRLSELFYEVKTGAGSFLVPRSFVTRQS